MFFFKDIKKFFTQTLNGEFFSEDTQRYYWLCEEGCKDFLNDYENLKGVPFCKIAALYLFSNIVNHKDKFPELENIKVVHRKTVCLYNMVIDNEIRNCFLYSDKGAFVQKENETYDDSFYSRKHNLELKNPQYLVVVI